MVSQYELELRIGHAPACTSTGHDVENMARLYMGQTLLLAVVIEQIHDPFEYKQGCKASHPAAVQRQ